MLEPIEWHEACFSGSLRALMVNWSADHGETALDAALRIVRKPDFGVLPIQGPPGSGKTYTGGRLICELVRRGARVGITANSHKVIVNLLDAAMEAADEQGFELKAVRKPGGSDNEPEDSRIMKATAYPKFFSNLAGDCQIGAGTAWLWSRDPRRRIQWTSCLSMKPHRCRLPTFWQYRTPRRTWCCWVTLSSWTSLCRGHIPTEPQCLPWNTFLEDAARSNRAEGCSSKRPGA